MSASSNLHNIEGKTVLIERRGKILEGQMCIRIHLDVVERVQSRDGRES